MEYIDAEKLKAEIERRRLQAYEAITADEPKYRTFYKTGKYDALRDLLDFITSLQQEPPEGIDGVVHHYLNVHWIITDHKQLAAALKAFPEGTEVELFIIARKEVMK